jgi:hypothetical protein
MIGAALFEVSNRRAEATGLTQDDVLYDLYIECKAWQKKSGKYWKMPGAFSRKLLQVKYAYDYPHLADAVKAGSVRMLFKWLIMKLTTLVEADPADHDPSEHAKTRGALFWNIGQAILIYERAPVILTRAQADGAFDHGIRGLQLYQELANKSLAAKSCVWKVRPKTHALAELFLQTAETCENPYYLDCFDFESFLRIVKNVVTKTHASTASYSTIERYLLLLTIRTLNRSPLVTWFTNSTNNDSNNNITACEGFQEAVGFTSSNNNDSNNNIIACEWFQDAVGGIKTIMMRNCTLLCKSLGTHVIHQMGIDGNSSFTLQWTRTPAYTVDHDTEGLSKL